MAKIMQDIDYISRKKKRYFMKTVGCVLVMIGVFAVGYITTGSRNNLFTLFAVVFTLAVAQNAVQWITFLKYKDGDKEIGEKLASLPQNYIIWNSILVTDSKGTAFFDHIVISDNKIFCITNRVEKDNTEDIRVMNRILERKGLKGAAQFIGGKGKGVKPIPIVQLISDLERQFITETQKQKEIVEVVKNIAM
jgi:heme/copper-type cytochrome/quinol oxidase subunit 4